jgi:hypothetical protein
MILSEVSIDALELGTYGRLRMQLGGTPFVAQALEMH